MKKIITICAAVAALALFAGNVQANHGMYGNSGFHQHNIPQNYGLVQPHGHSQWHNTSHFDYHPATVVPHGNHYHVTPGHYHLHQTGHYDLHW